MNVPDDWTPPRGSAWPEAVPSSDTPKQKQWGEGLLFALAWRIYHVVAITVCFALTILPAILPIMALLLVSGADLVASVDGGELGSTDFSALLPVIPLLTVWVGPALSGALYAWRRSVGDDEHKPGAVFWRGYRRNFFEVIRVWLPAVAVISLATLGISRAALTDIGLGGTVALVIFAAFIGTWALITVIIVTFFSFRTTDAMRLGAAYLVYTPAVAFGMLGLLIIAMAASVVTTPMIMLLFGGVWTWFIYRSAIPLIDSVATRFTI